MNYRNLYVATFLICLLSLNTFGLSKLNVKRCGAKGDGVTDDSKAIEYAMHNADTALMPSGTYLVSRCLLFSGLNNKTIIATGAVIKNNNDATGTIRFDRSKNIEIRGGTWTRTLLPRKQGGHDQHTFTFNEITNLTVADVTVNGSPEMGIAMINVNNANISHNRILNCYRDGIYAHYSVNLTYINNYLENIKDDAMSIHDYGIPVQKAPIIAAGYKQAGHSKVLNNTTVNTYQGFASIGCDDIVISDNNFSNTVNAGIAIANSETIFEGGNARTKNVIIKNNVLKNNGATQIILGVRFSNYGQLTTGRSALFIAVKDSADLINNPKSRMTNITVTGNIISGAGVNGAYVAQVDKLTFNNNAFTNCNTDNSVYCGNIVEIENCTDSKINSNKVIDDRLIKRHKSGYQIKNVTGVMANWTINGYLLSKYKLSGATPVYK